MDRLREAFRQEERLFLDDVESLMLLMEEMTMEQRKPATPVVPITPSTSELRDYKHRLTQAILQKDHERQVLEKLAVTKPFQPARPRHGPRCSLQSPSSPLLMPTRPPGSGTKGQHKGGGMIGAPKLTNSNLIRPGPAARRKVEQGLLGEHLPSPPSVGKRTPYSC